MAEQLLHRKVNVLEAKKESLFERIQELYDLSLKVSDPVIESKFLARILSLEKTRTDFLEVVDNLNLAYMELDEEVKPSYGVYTSMKMILYKSDQSPPARAVKMVIHILGLEVQQRELNPVLREQDTPEMKKKNPMRTIPFIDEGDFTLSDSHAIVIYLLEKYGTDEHQYLYPKDIRKRAAVNQRLFLDCGILFRQLRLIMGPVYQGQMSEISNDIIQGIKAAYWMLESYLSDTKFLADEVITLADICAVATVSSLDGLYPVDGKRLPKTRRWLTTMYEQEFCKLANEPGSNEHILNLKRLMEINKHSRSKL